MSARRRWLRAVVGAACLAAGCDGALLDAQTTRYVEAEGPIPNPGRGFLFFARFDGSDLGWIESGDTLVYSPIRLDPASDALPDDLEAQLDAGFAWARRTGRMVVARAVYNDGPEGDVAPDAPIARMRRHIETLGPILARNADVLLSVQAGLIGAWGEWHGSANDHGPEARQAVVDGWLAALPAQVSVQVRTPGFKIEVTGVEEPGGADRVGHHNDCFLSSETDVGTYPAGERARWLDWLEADTRGALFGGETCALHARNTCEAALAEMARLRVGFLNRGWHPDVIERWRADGCLDDIEARLGHRVVLDDATWPGRIARGDRLPLTVALHNAGFAPPRLPWRLFVFIVAADGAVAARWPVAVDPRGWTPGAHRVATSAAVDVPPGRYTIELGAWHAIDGTLGDDFAPRYGLRFANDGPWRAETGRNRLGAVEVLSGR